MKEALPHLIGGMVTGGILYWVYQEFSIPYAGLIWLATNIVLLACTVIFYTLYFKKRSFFSQRQWGILIFIVAAIWGIAWSLPPYLFLNSAQAEYIAIMLVIISMLATSPAPAMVHYISAYYVFLTLPMFALFFRLINMDLNSMLMIFMPFLWISLLAYGWQLHGTMINAIRLRLENEQTRKDAERASLAKSKFLAAASHDIRQPLQAVNLFLATLKNKVHTPEVADTFDQLESSVENMSELLNSLLDVSKLDAESIEPHPKHIDLDKMLNKSTDEFVALAQQKDISFYYDSAPMTAYADPVLLGRVINNLLSNAVRYTDHGSIQIRTHLNNGYIEIDITDTGKGIPENEQEEIFTEFYQLHNPERDKQKGLGVGLAIVKRLCDLQSWTVSLRSIVDEGSTFTLTIPVGDPLKVSKQPSKSFSNRQLTDIKVIIIEDDANVRDGLIALFEGWGCSVLHGETTEEIIQQDTSANWQPDLICSDFRLRNNLSGIDVISDLKEYYKEDIVSILITGDTDPQRVQMAKESGLTVLHKPVKPAQLRNVINRKFKRQ